MVKQDEPKKPTTEEPKDAKQLADNDVKKTKEEQVTQELKKEAKGKEFYREYQNLRKGQSWEWSDPNREYEPLFRLVAFGLGDDPHYLINEDSRGAEIVSEIARMIINRVGDSEDAVQRYLNFLLRRTPFTGARARMAIHQKLKIDEKAFLRGGDF